ncbi:MAG: hypothetical protein ACOC0M_05025, partial [Halomonas sp.]
RTLAALLVCRDAEQARERRETLLGRLPSLERVEVTPLDRLGSLAEACGELERKATRPADGEARDA